MAIKSYTEQNGTIGVIEVKGSLIGDEETDQFREAVSDFIEQGNRSLVIDLRKVNYVNSSGLGALIAAYSSYVKNGGKVKLAGLSNNVQNLLVVTKLINIFDVFDSTEEAIQSFLKVKST